MLHFVRESPSTGEMFYRCPICGPADTSGHLAVDFAKGVVFCYRHSQGYSVARLSALVGDPDLLRQALAAVHRPPTATNRRQPLPPTAPPPFPPLGPGDPGWTYLERRGIDADTIRTRGICRGTGRFAGRVVFPGREARTLAWRWCQGRRIDPEPVGPPGHPPGAAGTNAGPFPAVGGPRYMGPLPGEFSGLAASPGETLYGAEFGVSGMTRLIVCEGPISAARVGLDAVATWGKRWTSKQAEMLAALRPREVLLAAERDIDDEEAGRGGGRKAFVELGVDLVRRGLAAVYVIDVPASNRALDAGDLGRTALLELPRLPVRVIPPTAWGHRRH